MKYFVVFLAICSLVISFSEADEFGEKVKKIAEECKGQVGASDDDVARLFKYEPAANDKGKCLNACTMKQIGILDENNKVVEAAAIAYIKQVSGGDADFEKLSMETYNECKSTPESSDECEYAEAFRQCVIESAKSKGIKILPKVEVSYFKNNVWLIKKMKLLNICLIVCVALISNAKCNYEEAKAVANECKEEVGATDDEVESVLKFEAAETMTEKCLGACVMKRFGVMNGDGKFDREKAMEVLEVIANGNEEQHALGVEVLDACADIDVNEDHCEAAEEYRSCMHAKAKEIGFVMGRV
ncbi:uncharacterized protein LOC120774650 [Bactrocera tryoni]|uniref:uncharacterized protein LOC120774650 n=1 Tax=Bactrocera tryoni TaxID=59916 RepID=UPI001A98F983|nr:uncharacterized protein LOC120774650 [Bactrocera tryoni]